MSDCRMDEAPSLLAWQLAPPQSRLADDRAIAVLRAAVAAQPERDDFRIRLAHVLFDRDRMEDILALLEERLQAPDAPATALLLAGRAAALLDRHAEAIVLLERARRGGNALAGGELADVLRRTGETGKALSLAHAALVEEPNNSRAFGCAQKILFGEKAYDALLMLARELWARDSRNSEVLAVWAACAAALGDADLAMLTDRTRWFSRRSGVFDAAFNAALAGEIGAHDMLTRAQRYKATRGDGLRIPHLETNGGALAQTLLARVRAEAQRYLRERLSYRDHPVIARRPETAAMDSWALVLRGDGWENWHIHPRSWLSGVYYAAVPENGGEIGFGPLAAAGLGDEVFPSWRLKPAPGDLLLFPGYFAHRTWPTGSAAARISIAFDIFAAV